MTRIVLTGGGTAGHVMPHIAMLPYYQKRGWECFYLGGRGIERDLAKASRIPFYEIQTGKLRRYFSFENFIDIFRILLGFLQSIYILWKLKPKLVFSKGGFVSVPVAYAAWFLRIPVVSHESDLTPGLANKLMKPICRVIFCAFPETVRFLKPIEALEVGIPVRETLLQGSKEKGVELCGFKKEDLKTVLVMGGSSGAERINRALEEALPTLIQHHRVIHLAGKGKLLSFQHERYRAFEFLADGLSDILALADVVVSRSGANSIFELRELKKPMLLIPLEIASRGDQVDNARSFEAQGFAHVLRETDLNSLRLVEEINNLFASSGEMVKALESRRVLSRSSNVILERLSQILEK